MATVVLVVIGVWLLLSVVVTAACALVARAGQAEDRHRLDADRTTVG